MATYNGARFLPAQLDSIMAQTEPVDEIVITDDQSTDGTLDLVAAYAARSPVPIRAHRNPERLGFVQNFARAIGLCRSELIFLCDQDDAWLPDKVAVMKDAFADPAVLLAYHNADVITADDQPLYQLFDGTEQALNAVTPFHPWHSSNGLTQAFRASLRAYDDLWPASLNHIWLEGERLNHDQWYFFLAQVLGRVAYVDRPLVRYRQHVSNTIGASPRQPRGWWERMMMKLGHHPRLDRLRQDAGERRAVLLDRLAVRVDGAEVARVRAAAQRYRRLAAGMGRRHDMYVRTTLPGRLAAFGGLLRHADFRGHPWGFRPQSVLRDFLGGVVAHRVLPDQDVTGTPGAPSVFTP